MGETREDSLVEELYKKLRAKLLPVLEQLGDETRRYLYMLSWLNYELERRGLGRIIVTGGFAVEVYTGRAYRTMDVDIIVEKASSILEKFFALFSERIARGYLPREEVLAAKSIDIVSTAYTRRKPPVKLLVDSYHVYIEPPEDLIVVYLAGWKYWRSTEDRDKALWLLGVLREKLDYSYLEERSREESVEDKLRELIEILDKG